jgi:hypothetical protein
MTHGGIRRRRAGPGQDVGGRWVTTCSSGCPLRRFRRCETVFCIRLRTKRCARGRQRHEEGRIVWR